MPGKFRKDGMLCPVFDPDSPKYKDDPDRVWFSGQWRTLEQVEAKRMYNKSEKGKAVAKRYEESEKGKATRRAYEESEKRKAFFKRYEESEKGKAIRRAYAESEKGKATRRAYEESEHGKYMRLKKDIMRIYVDGMVF